MINVEWFNLTENAVVFFIMGLLGVMRERTVLPYLIVIFGSFLRGDVAAVLVAALMIWFRSEKDIPEGWSLKDSIAFFCLVAATALPSPYREFLIFMGVVAFSVFSQKDSLGIIPAFFLIHLYFEEGISPEILFGFSLLYVAARELFFWAKVPRQDLILRVLGYVSLCGILFPLRDLIFMFIENQTLWIGATGVTVFLGAMTLWLFLKKKRVFLIYRFLQHKNQLFFDGVSRWLSIRQTWIRPPKEESVSIPAYAQNYFWWIFIVLSTWALLVAMFIGGFE